jgi:hypothetical protein
MKPCPLSVLALLALAPSFTAQSAREDLRPLRDFFFEEHEDGSILTADARGTYVFPNLGSYARSAFFEQHGVRCGFDRLAHPLSFSVVNDCNSSNTNPAAQYAPATGPDFVIPVVFHIIRRTSGTTGQVSDALIHSQIEVMNEDFGAFGAGAPGTNVRVQFTLAGITRTSNNGWYDDTGPYYDTLAWDPTQYLNIYSNSASGYLGYSYVPSSGGVVGNLWDRVVVLWSTVGRPGPYGSPYDLGRTVTHEVGHYLGLYHTFQGGCSSPSGCHTNGDLICDTNPESSPNFSPCTRSSCGLSDPTHNYMDYSDDVCMNQFTAEQANRIRCTLANFRVDLPEVVLPGPAANPSPVHGATGILVDADVSWTAGSSTTSHDVYFGTNPSPGPGEFQGNKLGTSYDPGTLAFDTSYYWRIDELNSSGTTTGSVWSFHTELPHVPPAQAASPIPLDAAPLVGPSTNLTWTKGFGATSHDVYFGTTDPPLFVGNQPGVHFDPGTMARLTTYYWRIDEVNAYGTTTGVVWSFTTTKNLQGKQL